ncbi:MAG: hypothetical protein PUK40_06975 [Actinomycetaceae bacterium]|nr:hypothetical protein [Arcanobacterium sp.]MDD7505662.1 hypothetical protein [Actinomycetaceae bacterium]MDY6143447.1 hypothetical protein [Arcanobacterium sp.]
MAYGNLEDLIFPESSGDPQAPTKVFSTQDGDATSNAVNATADAPARTLAGATDAPDALSDPQRKKLFIAAVVGVAVALVLLVVFIGAVIANNRDIAESTSKPRTTTEEPETPEVPQPEATPEEEATHEEDPTAEPLRELRANVANCSDVDSVIASLAKYTTAVSDAGDWTDQASNDVSTSLESVGTNCSASFAVELYRSVQSQTFPDAISDHVKSGTWIPRAAPAPSGASEMASFRAPSDNIGCDLSNPNGVTCTIYRYSFTPPQGCELTTSDAGDGLGPLFDTPVDGYLSIDGSGSIGCSSAEVASANVLGYGSSATNGFFACRMDESGVTCWNTITGSTFTLARESAGIQ